MINHVLIYIGRHLGIQIVDVYDIYFIFFILCMCVYVCMYVCMYVLPHPFYQYFCTSSFLLTYCIPLRFPSFLCLYHSYSRFIIHLYFLIHSPPISFSSFHFTISIHFFTFLNSFIPFPSFLVPYNLYHPSFLSFIFFFLIYLSHILLSIPYHSFSFPHSSILSSINNIQQISPSCSFHSFLNNRSGKFGSFSCINDSFTSIVHLEVNRFPGRIECSVEVPLVTCEYLGIFLP